MPCLHLNQSLTIQTCGVCNSLIGILLTPRSPWWSGHVETDLWSLLLQLLDVQRSQSGYQACKWGAFRLLQPSLHSRPKPTEQNHLPYAVWQDPGALGLYNVPLLLV